MPDLEKVIKGLQIERECVSRDCDRDCGKCDLVQDRDWLLSVYDDALELLKEREAKTGHWVSVNDGDVVAIDDDGFPERACFCSECKKYLIASDEYAVYGRYCPFCGAKMEGR